MTAPEIKGNVVSPEGAREDAQTEGGQRTGPIPRRGQVVDTKSVLPGTLPPGVWEGVLLVTLTVTAGVVLLISYLVVGGHLSQIYLTVLIADSEVGLVLVTIYLLVVELRRDRKGDSRR